MAKKSGLTMRTRLGYAAGEMGTTLSFYMISNYLTMYYVDGVGIAAAVVSGLILVVRLIEAFSAPVIGSVIDRTASKFGQARPWILYGTPFLILFAILTFTSFNLGDTGNVVYAIVSYIGLAIAFSFVDTAKSALANTITADADDRVTLNGWRQACGNVLNTVLAAITMPLILMFGNNATAYTYTAAIYAIASLPLLMFCFTSCKETVRSAGAGERITVRESLMSAVTNSQLLLIVLSTTISCIGVFSRLGVMTFYYNYAVGRPDATGLILAGFQIAQILPPFVAPFIIKKLNKKGALILGNAGMAASAVFLFLIGFDNVALVFVGTFLLGFFGFSSFVCICAVSDCIEYNYNTKGNRNPGASVGAITFGVKLAMAIGGALGALLIGFTGYVSGADLTMEVRTNISLVVNIVPAVFFALSAVPALLYKLDNKEMERIQKENSAKDAAAAAAEKSVA